jgi:hypothetical protein
MKKEMVMVISQILLQNLKNEVIVTSGLDYNIPQGNFARQFHSLYFH